MIPCSALDKMKKERGMSSHFPITHLNSPSVFMTKDYRVGAVLKVDGIPFETEQDLVLDQLRHQWHRSLLSIAEEFGVYVSLYRHRCNRSLEGKFKNTFLRDLNREYFDRFSNEPFYENDLYLTLISKSKFSETVRPLKNIFRIYPEKVSDQSNSELLKNQITKLENQVEQLMHSMSAYSVRRLGLDQRDNKSELLSFLSLFLNGDMHLKPKLYNSVESLGYSLSKSRLFFTDFIEFNQEKKKIGAMLSVKRYPTESVCKTMGDLLKIDAEYILTNSFFSEDKASSQRIISRQRQRLLSVNDFAKTQIKELEIAQELVASDQLMFGGHHSSILLLSDTVDRLSQSISKVKHIYAEHGYVAIQETIGQEPTFWAQIPGNMSMIARKSLVSSENFVDFCPLYNYRQGYINQNHLGSAVTLLKTHAKTPFYFNFHAKGDARSPSKGHVLMIGGNGSGKTLTLSFLDAQRSRYGGKSFIFDRDRGMEIYVRASGGVYMNLSPDNVSYSFNPLQLPDTQINRSFCYEWFAQLIKNEDEIELPVELTHEIKSCVNYAFESLPRSSRCLSNAAALLPIDFSRWPQIRRWLRADGEHPEGEYAYLFDHDKDDFDLSPKMGFDLTYFLEHESKNVLIALMMYLFHQIQRSADGDLITIILDEAWQYLDNAYWVQKLRKWLPTLRKQNCHLILSTQSVVSVVESNLRSMILDNVATQIYFPNSQAQSLHYCDGLNLNESEFCLIRDENWGKRFFLVKQGQESCLCTLDLSEMGQFIGVLSSHKQSIKRLETCMNEVGKDPNAWLPIFIERNKS